MQLKLRNELKGDIYGGLAAAIVTIPVAIGYGEASGLGSEAGMLGAVLLCLSVSIFGGTPTQISCPVGAITVVVVHFIYVIVGEEGSLATFFPLIVLTFVLAAIIQLLLGILRLGAYVRYVPYSVISGFLSGIGIIIISLQLKHFFGSSNMVQETTLKAIFCKLMSSIDHIHFEKPYALLLSIGTLLIIIVTPRFRLTSRMPGSAAAILIMTPISMTIPGEFETLGEFELELPTIQSYTCHITALAHSDWLQIMRPVLAGAFSLALLSSINSLLTSVVADKMTDSFHDSNKELIGQGVGNLLAGLTWGLPGGGAVACTVANIKSGGRSRLSGLVCGTLLLLVLVLGGPFISIIPRPVLAAILVYIGIVLIDIESIKNARKIPLADNIAMFAVMTLTFWDLLTAVITGLVISSVFFMKKMADVVELDSRKGKIDRLAEELISSFRDAEGFKRQVFIKTIRGPVFFGFSSRFLNSMRHLPEDVRAVIFNLAQVPYMDHSGIRTFEAVIRQLQQRGINVCICDINKRNLKMIENFMIIPQKVDYDHLFGSLEECIMWLEEPGHIENDFSRDGLLYIPPAFTPNDDGINDSWRIRHLGKHDVVHIKVTDKTNRIVYNETGFDNPWDGKYNGQELPSGEYFYEIDLKDGETPRMRGSVHLFK